MNIQTLVNKALDKTNFNDLQAYIHFAEEYLTFVSEHLQAEIVSQNEIIIAFINMMQVAIIRLHVQSTPT